MGVQADHEEKREMMCVPERLEALLAHFVVRGCVHDDHDEEHEVASDASGLCVVDLHCALLADLCTNHLVTTGSRQATRDVRVRSTLMKLT